MSIDLKAQGDLTIGGDVVGRDKIVTVGYTTEQVSALLAQISATFQPKPFDGRCPYRGLDVFDVEDAELFFGREKLVAELVARVKVSEGIRPGVIAYSLGFGHWAYGASDIEVDSVVIRGDPDRARGVHLNPVLRTDPYLANTCLEDLVGGSAVFYDTRVRLLKVG